jgi:hypothetical protein
VQFLHPSFAFILYIENLENIVNTAPYGQIYLQNGLEIISDDPETIAIEIIPYNVKLNENK